MSKWSHNVCAACYVRVAPGRRPIRLLDAPPAKCCFCGGAAEDGIYVRNDPKRTPRCAGHED